MRYLVYHRDQMYVKVYEFLSFVENMNKFIRKKSKY